jgi:hypothetical protein
MVVVLAQARVGQHHDKLVNMVTRMVPVQCGSGGGVKGLSCCSVLTSTRAAAVWLLLLLLLLPRCVHAAALWPGSLPGQAGPHTETALVNIRHALVAAG